MNEPRNYSQILADLHTTADVIELSIGKNEISDGIRAFIKRVLNTVIDDMTDEVLAAQEVEDLIKRIKGKI